MWKVPFENTHLRRDSGASLFKDLSDAEDKDTDTIPDIDTTKMDAAPPVKTNTEPLWFHQAPP